MRVKEAEFNQLCAHCVHPITYVFVDASLLPFLLSYIVGADGLPWFGGHPTKQVLATNYFVCSVCGCNCFVCYLS